nr:phosphonate ABC transporter, permease protein PhnE [Leucobacter komagatae]
MTLPPKPRGSARGPLVFTLVVVVTVAMCLPVIGIGVDFGAIARNWHNGADKLVRLLQPDWAFFPRTIRPLVETLQMAVVATAIGSAVALPLSFWAARSTNPFAPGRALLRGILNVVRAVPDLLYAAVLVAMVGVGALPGMLALLLFNVGILVKLVSEAIDTNDPGPIEAGRAVGGTQLQINRSLALPDAWPAFANQALYTFELNVRASTVLGLVGAGGLGLLIDAVRTFYRYDQLSLIILEILIIVIAIDAVSSAVRKRLV